jgi:hexosaminidase
MMAGTPLRVGRLPRPWRGAFRGQGALLTAVAVLGAAVLALPVAAAETGGDLELIPQPILVERCAGSFTLDAHTAIRHSSGAGPVARLLQEELEDLTGLALSFRPMASGGEGALTLELDEAMDSRPEAYRLEVSPERVTLRAPDEAGLFYATRTLRQLLSRRGAGGREPSSWAVPCGAIQDAPRFGWRGLMLDCSRTFQSLAYLRKTMDRMAFYKMNVLHLHLTDDQGWRLEIKSHPELTARGARFPDHWNEPPEHHGYYTQADMRELIQYAADRQITIVPEIEMPGHALAALAVYPRLSCSGGPFEIHPFFKGENIHEDIFCAGNDDTFRFLEDVLEEVVALFPSEVVHVGGDEAPKGRWETCPKCQARIRAEGLEGEDELQSWFIERIGRFVESRGKRIIGWDEILQGGIPAGAAVMSWRGIEGGIAAAEAGHDAVMSPTSHCYFDYTYERIDTRRAYSYEPVPETLAADRAGFILGLQANFWSHINREPDEVDAQIFPRLLAIAERGWSPENVRDWEDFRRRVEAHLPDLEAMGIRYHEDPSVVETVTEDQP